MDKCLSDDCVILSILQLKTEELQINFQNLF